MLSNRKNKLLIILLTSLCFITCYADDLVLNITNKNNSDIKISFVKSNESEKFEPLSISPNVSKKIELDFADHYQLQLKITDSNSNLISDFAVYNSDTPNPEFEYVVPGGGALPKWSCSWNRNRIIVNKIIGYRHDPWISWIPFLSPSYHGEVDFTVIPEQSTESNSDLEFTLFALPKSDKFNEIQLDSIFTKEEDIKNKKLSLENWDIQEFISLNTTAYHQAKDIYTRWVNLIIHNYTSQSFLFYGIDEAPEDDHIQFPYKENYLPNYTVFYPPQTQLQGPDFKFSVKKENDNFILSPDNEKNQFERDKYFLIIGHQADLSNKTLEYIPLKITTGMRLGKVLDQGARVSSFENYAYQVEFIPVNVNFSASNVSNEAISEKIRLPLGNNGKPIFSLSPMTKINIETENNQLQNNRVAVKYLISGTSSITNKKYTYRLILIAPPFAAADTPGKFSPGHIIPDNSEIGNFLRYPLHIYLLSANEKSNEENLKGYETITELPEELIGSIEYFVSDKDHKQKNIEEEVEEEKQSSYRLRRVKTQKYAKAASRRL